MPRDRRGGHPHCVCLTCLRLVFDLSETCFLQGSESKRPAWRQRANSDVPRNREAAAPTVLA
jgi:hypothetical protein